jgi:Lrp/AsnC family transcriptional regulator, regulator for asnA, asnC and gidA
MSVDDIDRQLIQILNTDGRIPNNEIATTLKVSEGTVRNRCKKLTEAGLLKVVGLINPDDSPTKQLMLLGVNITSSKNLAKKAAEISRLPNVESAYITAGRYDIMVEVWIDAKGGLIEFLSQTLAKVEGIASTESFLVMKSFNKWLPRADL